VLASDDFSSDFRPSAPAPKQADTDSMPSGRRGQG
jgi:hypothetical protein